MSRAEQPRDPSTEPTALALLPGMLLDHALWRHQVEHLADIARPWVADFSKQVSIAEMAGSVLAAMPERFALAGLSMGGYVALEVLRQAPQRVTRLALLSTRAHLDSPDYAKRREALIAIAQRGRFLGVSRHLMRHYVHEARHEDGALLDSLTAMAQRLGRDAYLRQQTAILNRPDARSTLVTIACPTLVVCGREDEVTPVSAHMELAAGIAEARLVILDDCGHLPPLEQPERTTAELRDWLLEPEA
jgi:pimeloyl-ACP methyl ester carboxylesterase